MSTNSCEYCIHYIYDDIYDYYTCEIDLDMDAYERFLTDAVSDCPYYRGGDDYTIVRRQN